MIVILAHFNLIQICPSLISDASQQSIQSIIMLSKLAPRFVIRGVIQNAYYANYMSVELVKQVIGESHSTFYLQDPKHYFQCNFFGYLSRLDKPTEFVDQFQVEKYEQAVQKFAVYNQVKQLFQALNQFTLQLRELYRTIEINNTSSNFFSRSTQSDEVWEADVNDAIQRYHNFLDKLQPYPEWKEKVVEEVGKWLLMIHNNLAEGEVKRDIFAQLNRQEYFV